MMLDRRLDPDSPPLGVAPPELEPVDDDGGGGWM